MKHNRGSLLFCQFFLLSVQIYPEQVVDLPSLLDQFDEQLGEFTCMG